MGILDRFTDIMSSNINAILDKFEDPSKMVDQYLRNAKKDLASVKSETAGIMAAEKSSKRTRDELEAKVQEYLEMAQRAVDAGDDAGAAKLLTKKNEFAQQLVAADKVYQTHRAQAENMTKLYNKLVSDIQNLEARKANVKATAAAAKTQETVNKFTSGSAKAGAVLDKFSDMEKRAQEALDRAQAESELNLGVHDDTEELRAKYGAGASQSVTDELAAMKAARGMAPSVSAEVAAELEAMKAELGGDN